MNKRKICLNCGKKIRKRRKKYCSQRCGKNYLRRYKNKMKNSYESNEELSIKICLNCKKEIKKEPILNSWKTYKIKMPETWWQNKKFCCRKCASAYNARKKYRKNPEKYREYRKEWIKNNMTPERKKKYNETRRKRGREYRAILKKEKPEIIKKRNDASKLRYIKLRERILEHYNWKCAICGFDEVLDVHHFNNKHKTSWNKSLSEYIVLCPNHHIMFHRGKITKKELMKWRKKD